MNPEIQIVFHRPLIISASAEKPSIQVWFFITVNNRLTFYTYILGFVVKLINLLRKGRASNKGQLKEIEKIFDKLFFENAYVYN